MRFFCFALALTVPALCQTTGSIKGTVTQDSGQPAANVRVVAVPATAAAKTVRGASASNGTFTIAGLGAGSYTICAQDPGGVYLDPCQWSTPVKVTVAAGQAVSNVAVPVAKGTTLQVRVEDPQRITNPAKEASDLMLAVVLNGGKLLPMSLPHNDRSGKVYQVAVPPGTTHHIAVLSRTLRIADSRGVPLQEKGDGKGNLIFPHFDAPVSNVAGIAPVTLSILGKK